MIAVVDYKAGNLTSVMKALRAVDADAVLSDEPGVVLKADKVILPGVGHFAATRFLRERGLEQAICERVRTGVPFLGICVGLQWLFAGSSEAPDVQGFGAFDGMCDRFRTTELKVPHVGWNSLEIREGSRLLAGVSQHSFVYFTHSYCAPVVESSVAVAEYGQPFTAAVERDNVMGVQFHPEKSAAAGRQVLENFVRLAC
ncbi:MAG: imidazole glycerol phosphate synthase subunit HisH [Acidobacteriaceae bacterium]